MEKRRGWSDLQPELLELVLQKLVVWDYLKCRRVCRQWRTTVSEALETKKRCPPAPQFTSLLLLPRSLGKEKVPATLFDLTRNNLQDIPTQSWESYFEVIHSQDGWLMFQGPDQCDHYDPSRKVIYKLFWIFNPISGEKYNLPPLLCDIDQPCISATPNFKATFSSAQDSQNFLVVICTLCKLNSISQLHFCKLVDKSWTPIETNESRSTFFCDIVLLGWKLYAINRLIWGYPYTSHCGTVFNLRDVNAITTERLVIKLPMRNDGAVRTQFWLAEDSTRGEVLLVFCTSVRERERDEIKDICIYKLGTNGSEWIKVNSFSGRALFVDYAGLKVISTTELNGPPELIEGDCAFYWTEDLLSPYRKTDPGVFFLKDKTIQRFHVNSSRINCQCLWFTPSPW